MEEMNIREFVKIKSDRLNYEDFIMGPQDFTIARLGKKIDQGNPRLLMFFEGREETPYWASKGMLKCLSNVDGWGESEFSEWVGRKVRLFGEPTVVYAGKEMGGIQISHISHIEKEFTTKITLRRGLRVDFTIYPLIEEALPAYCPQKFKTNLPAWQSAIESGAATAEKIIAKLETVGTLTEEQKKQIQQRKEV